MAMQIESYGINVAAIYRPLNNIFLNKKMEKIRKILFVKTNKKGDQVQEKCLNYLKMVHQLL